MSENDANQRLDSFLKKLLKGAPLSLIFKLLRKNGVKVNKKRKPQEYKLVQNEVVDIYLKDEEFEEFLKKESFEENTSMKSKTVFPVEDILFEDEYILVINKNPFVSVHPGDHKSDSVSLIEQVQDYL